MRCGRSITADSGDQLLMLDSPSTGAEDPVVFNAVRYVQRTVTLVFQKRYLLDHLRLQIVTKAMDSCHGLTRLLPCFTADTHWVVARTYSCSS